MNNLQLAFAAKALDRLSDQPMNLKNSYKIMKLQRRVRPLYELYSNAESKIIDDLGLFDCMEGTQIHFKTKESADEYRKLHQELDEIDAEFDPKWKVKLDPEDKIKMTPRDAELLIDMVDFGFEEDSEDE